jgi:hypothetical protein
MRLAFGNQGARGLEEITGFCSHPCFRKSESLGVDGDLHCCRALGDHQLEF